MNIDGTLIRRGSAPEEYSTDVLAQAVQAFIADAATQEQPFFAYFAPHAPHEPAEPAPRHAASFIDATMPRSPSFNEADVSDKPAFVSGLPVLDAAAIAEVDDLHRRRLATLLAVDDAVAGTVATLEATGALANTYLIFTSDNGYLSGEHRLGQGKIAPYDEAIRVPLVIRGPGIPAGETREQLALNIDLAPTIAAWADVAAPAFVDGRSLASLLSGEPTDESLWRSAFLVERFAPGGSGEDEEKDAENPGEENDSTSLLHPTQVPEYRAIRAESWLYVEYATGEREFYDLRTDPFQLENRADQLDETTRHVLSTYLQRMTTCGAASCRTLDSNPPPITLA